MRRIPRYGTLRIQGSLDADVWVEAGGGSEMAVSENAADGTFVLKIVLTDPTV
jgi:hypothetical protein